MTSTLSFIGKNIRYLRRQRGLTLAQLAAKSEMSEGPLGRIERGANAPSASVIYRLAKALGVSIDTFFAETSEDLRCIQYEGANEPLLVGLDRGMDHRQENLPTRVQQMAREVIEAFQALEDICHVQKHARIPLSIPFDPDKPGMEALAGTVRRFMGIEHGIVFDYFELFESQGFRVIVVPMPKQLDTFAFYDAPNQNAFFFLNVRGNPERQLFSLAYDLGSILIQTQLAQQCVKLFPTEEDTQSRENKPFTAHRAARRFAGNFLMPARAVKDTVAQLGIRKKRWSWELLLRIKHRFGVSAEAFLYRLNELKLIDSSLVERLKRRIGDHYKETGYAEPGLSKRLLTPNGRLWDLMLTGKSVAEAVEEVQEIEDVLDTWRVVKSGSEAG